MRNLRYRLALDLGSTSLGWAVFRLDLGNVPTAIIRVGSRIFSDGRNPKDGSSLAVTRREARAMRRRRDRLLRRKERLLRKLVEYGFFPADEAARKALERLNPYELRARGLREPLQPGEFARALFHLNQRRGFKSNRKTDKKDSDSSALKKAISQLRQRLEASGSRTVGDWFWTERMQEKREGIPGQGVRARYREMPYTTDEGKKRIDKSYDLYIDRHMVEQEFDALWAAQIEFNPALFHEAARTDLKDTLLHQRPLRPVKPGRCTLLPEEERAPLALPSTQRFRIYQEVNNLRLLGDDLRESALTSEQRDAVVGLLERRDKVTFEQIRKLLKLGSGVQFNLEDAKRTELKGNATSAKLSKKELFGSTWSSFSEELQDEIAWRLVTEESEGALIAWLQEHASVDEAHAQAIADASLPEGYGSLSRLALTRILPVLRADVITYDKAVQAAGFAHHSDLGFDFDHAGDEVEQIGERTIESTGEIKPVHAFKQLPYYGRALQRHVAFGNGKLEDPEEKRYGKIANPTVHIGLNQVRTVVNALTRRYGRPAEVVIELARDLKQSREQKQEAQRRQAENQKRNARIRKSIAEVLGISEERVRIGDIQKWILWEELSFDVVDRRCPYSGVQISASMLLSEQVEIEHILPFSDTLDDSLNNRTVALRQANRVKRNRTPWAARTDFEAQGWSYEAIQQRAERMPKGKRYRFASDGYERWLGEDKGGFLARALNDTRYLSRVAAEYLRLICPQGTRVIPGQMTALLRGKFGLNDVLGLNGEKNRNDHRHHAVDACVIGVTDQGLLQRFARANAEARDKGLTRLVEDMPMPWPTYRDHVERAVRHIWVSHRPDHGYEGALHEETAYRPPHLDHQREWRTRGINGSKPNRKSADSTAMVEIMGQLPRYKPNNDGLTVYKGYIGGSNYCIEITTNDKGKWEGNVISTFQSYAIVHKTKKLGLPHFDQLRHPLQGQNKKTLVMRLVIGDSVRLEIEGMEQIMRIVKMSSAGQVFMAPVHEANVAERVKQGLFSYSSKSGDAFRAAKARKVTISPIGELRDPGFKG